MHTTENVLTSFVSTLALHILWVCNSAICSMILYQNLKSQYGVATSQTAFVTEAVRAFVSELSKDHHGNFTRGVGWKDCGSAVTVGGLFSCERPHPFHIKTHIYKQRAVVT